MTLEWPYDLPQRTYARMMKTLDETEKILRRVEKQVTQLEAERRGKTEATR